MAQRTHYYNTDADKTQYSTTNPNYDNNIDSLLQADDEDELYCSEDKFSFSIDA